MDYNELAKHLSSADLSNIDTATNIAFPMETRHSVAYIKHQDYYTKQKCTICKMEYFEYEDGTYRWIFSPLWDRIDNPNQKWLPALKYLHIHGIHMERHLEQYRFKDCLPPFVYEHSPPPNRVDAMEMMAEAGLKRFDRFDYMVGTKMIWGSDQKIIETTDEDDYE